MSEPDLESLSKVVGMAERELELVLLLSQSALVWVQVGVVFPSSSVTTQYMPWHLKEDPTVQISV